MKKRITALFLLVCMLLTLLPLGALAEEDTAAAPAPVAEGENQSGGEGGTGNGEGGGETHTHTWGAWTDAGNGQHTRKCTGCDETQTAAHTWGSWTDNGKGQHTRKCADCGAEESADHSYSSDFKSNGDGTHSKVCSVCGAKTETAKCDDTLGEAVSNGDGTHSRTCSVCGYKATEKCVAGTEATCTSKAVCKVCGAEFGDVKHTEAAKPYHVDGTETHQYYCEKCKTVLRTENCTKKTVSNGDGTHNVICTVCGKILEEDVPCASDPAADECGKRKICKECGEAFGDPLPHDKDVNGVCKRIATGKCHCTQNHQALWTKDNASEKTIQCPECGATIEKQKISVAFKVGKYQVNGKTSSLTVTSGNSHVKVGKISVSPADSKFKADTQYTVTVPYTVDPGYEVTSATIGGQKATLTDTSATATLPKIGTEYKVTFNTQGHGTAPKEQTVKYNGTAKEPTAPTEKNYAFCGWYTDKECKNKFSFSTPITGDTTLYASWKESYTLQFHTNGGKSISSVNIPKGDKVNLKDYTTTRSGYYFSGWYKSSKLTGSKITSIAMTAENADTKGVVHVYAKWKKEDTTNPKTGDDIGWAVGVLTLTTVLGAAVVTKKKRVW